MNAISAPTRRRKRRAGACQRGHLAPVCTGNPVRIDLLTESLTVGRNRSNTDFAVNLVSIVRVFERPIRRYLVDRL